MAFDIFIEYIPSLECAQHKNCINNGKRNSNEANKTAQG